MPSLRKNPVYSPLGRLRTISAEMRPVPAIVPVERTIMPSGWASSPTTYDARTRPNTATISLARVAFLERAEGPR